MGTGPYKGVCLRVEHGPAPAGSWARRALSVLLPGSGLSDRKLIKARIPEIHAMLPIPELLGSNADQKSNSVIDMYPTFVAQDSNAPEPVPGELVWLDFGNKVGFTDPIYIKPVEMKGTFPAGAGDVSGKAAQGCVGKLNMNKPSGDALAGQNKALSHSGLPLLPRQAGNVVSGQVRVVKGAKFSPSKLAQWETAVAKGIPGTTWFGVLNSNGLVDEKHPDGKRSTLMFAPNTTNFSAPVELMYFFHGKLEFGNKHDFAGR
jgi:hypothetical protein